MAALAHQDIGFAGTNITYTAASGGGDTTNPDDRVFLLVKNGGGSSINVTITVPGSTFEQVNPDVVVSVPNGGERFIGPLNEGLTAAETFTVVLIAYSGVTSVTVAAVRVGDVQPPLP